MYSVRSISAILVVALIIVISIEHPIGYFRKLTFFNKPMTRSAAVVLTYGITFAGLITLISLGLPEVFNQARKLLQGVEIVVSDLTLVASNESSSVSELVANLVDAYGVITAFVPVFSNVTAVFSLIIISIYMSLDWENIKKRFVALFPGKDQRSEVESTIDEIEVSVGHWVKGQMTLMLLVGGMSFIGLSVLGVDFAMALAVIAGLLEIVPIVGPIIALVVAAIVAFSTSKALAFAVIILFVLIQQLENNFLVPKVMHRVSGFSPLAILIAVLIGSSLFGVVGALTAVPIMMIGVIIIKRAIRYSPPFN